MADDNMADGGPMPTKRQDSYAPTKATDPPVESTPKNPANELKTAPQPPIPKTQKSKNSAPKNSKLAGGRHPISPIERPDKFPNN